MKRLHVIGRKNSGKTTLVEDLLKHFTSRGKKVGSIKHTHHHHELDVPGKDSHRHRQAGASPVAILSPGMTAVFRPTDAPPCEEDYAWLAPLFADCDLVLVEGNSQTTAPKVEVWRAATSTEPMAVNDPTILAVITDDDLTIDRPVWKRSDVDALGQQLFAREWGSKGAERR